MAKSAGIEMEDSRLFPVEGVNHFLTRRFDRKEGKKLYTQTLAAINPEARSYEELLETCRALSLSEREAEQLYRRMVFNVMTNNTDDHSKNFSFILAEGGRWRLAPAYDMTFIFDPTGTAPNFSRRFGIGGKISGITKSDLLEFAGDHGIRNAPTIIDEVAGSIARFHEYAEKNRIPQPWRGIIQKFLTDTLIDYGYQEQSSESQDNMRDRFGRTVSNISLSVNTKGNYEISAVIEGRRRRRFIRKEQPEYESLSRLDIYNMPSEERLRIIEKTMPLEG